MDTTKQQAAQSLFKQIKDTDDQGYERELVLELITVLLGGINLRESELEELAASDELIDLAIGYLDVSDQCVEFYDTILPYLEDELEEFIAGIKTTTEKISYTEQCISDHRRNHAKLLSNEKKLRKNGKRLDSLERVLAELKILHQRLDTENLSKLQAGVTDYVDAIESTGRESVADAIPHLASNSEILKAVAARPEQSREMEEKIKKAQELANGIEQGLKTFEDYLTSLHEDREKIIASIRTLNNT